MGEHLRTAPFPVLAIYGAQDIASVGFKLAAYMEKARVRPLRWARDHALPLKKMSDRRYETYTPVMILKKGWTAKHQEQIPGGILVVYETDALTPTATAAAVALLDRVRANVVTSGRSGLPVALAVFRTGPDPDNVEEKNAFLIQLKKATTSGQQASSTLGAIDRTTLRSPTAFNQAPPAALVVLSMFDLEKESEQLMKFKNQLKDAIYDYYKSEIARIKAIKRGDRRSGAVALKVRHEFKCAQYYEMRSLSEKALLHYGDAYQALISLATTWQRDETSEYQAHEIRGAAEIVHYRICALRLEAGEPRQALAQLRNHLRSMTPLLDPSHDSDEYYEWMSRQHVLFAGLISSASTSDLSVAFGALDPCERERCSGIFHLSKASLHAKKISKPERALDLIERLIDINARKRKIHTRREATLLISVAEERFRIGDEKGALRDMDRAASVFRKDGWNSLYAQILLKADEILSRSRIINDRIPYTSCDAEAQFIVLYSKDETNRKLAMDHLLHEKLGSEEGSAIDVVARLIEATLDEGGRRILLKSFFPSQLRLKSVHSSTDAEAEFGLQCVADFSDDPALIPENGSLLFDCTDETIHVQNAVALVLVFDTGARWKVTIHNATPTMFAITRSDSLSRHIENHRRQGLVTKLLHESRIKNNNLTLACEGLPPGNLALVGESFVLKCDLSDPTEKCLIECECEANWLKIHGTTTPGLFTIEITPSDTLFVDQPTSTQLTIVAFIGTLQIARRCLDLSTMWPFVLGVSKRISGKVCAIEFESTSVPLSVSQSSVPGLEGSWQPGDRRVALIDVNESNRVELTVNRDASMTMTEFNNTGSWQCVLQLPDMEDTLLRTVDGMDCQLSFNPCNPWFSLGEMISMKMSLVYTGDTFDPVSTISDGSYLAAYQQQISNDGADGLRKVKLIFEPASGFFLSGVESATYSIYPSQRVDLTWSLYPYEVGPQRLPGIWLEVANEAGVISRRRVECPDSLCIVVPKTALTSIV